MTTKIAKNKKDLGSNVYSYQLTIDKDQLKKEFDVALEKALKTVKVEGFRQGKAPKDLASKQLDHTQLYSDALNVIIPMRVDELMKEENLHPIVSPRVKLLEQKDGEDWVIEVTFVLKPEIKLPDYKKRVQDIKADHKKNDIWVPGKDEKQSEEEKNQNQSKLLNTILDALLNESKVQIADILIEDEYNKKLGSLLDELQKIGLSIEAYAKSKDKTIEQLKDSIKHDIMTTYALELILEEIAEKEQITVEKEDLEKLFATADTTEKKQEIEKNAYFYATLLRRQKILDFLLGA